MPKKCSQSTKCHNKTTEIKSSTKERCRKVQESYEICSSKHSRDQDFSAPSEKLLEIKSRETSGSVHCNCSRRRVRKRKCAALKPTIYCDSHEKQYKEKERTSRVKNKCCCGGAKEKKKNSEGKSSTEAKDQKLPKALGETTLPARSEPCKFKDVGTNPKPDLEQLWRPCYCPEPQVKRRSKKSLSSSVSSFCCTCFRKLWKDKRKKKPKKKKKGLAAPCNRYLCLYNEKRLEYDEPVPCVKCTHNCKARSLEANKKKSSAKGAPVELVSNTAPKTLEISEEKLSVCQAMGTENSVMFEITASVKTENKAPKKKSSETEKGREKDYKDGKIRKSKKQKICKRRKKAKQVNHCVPACSQFVKVPVENTCCNCEVVEMEIESKKKPCMKCPNRMGVGENGCKKLTFASCSDLRDYNLKNNNNENNKKKRINSFGVVFDVIFWPYVFWPSKKNYCK